MICWTRKCVKAIQYYLEASGREVPELAYHIHGQLSSAADADRTDGHVVYQMTETAVVALWEDRRLMAADTTGLRTWQAGKALLDWYLLRPEAIQGRRVLELGAGLGLTGLALCRTCSPASYHVTDGHPLVVEMLKYNVLKNLELAEDDLPVVDESACAAFVSDAPASAPLKPCGGPADGGATCVGDLRMALDGTELRAGTLDWFTFTAEEARDLDVDLVLTADVTYNPELHEPLVRTLRLLLDHVRRPPEVLMALTDRNEGTTAPVQGLKPRLLATPANNQSSFLMDEVSKVKIFQINPHPGSAGRLTDRTVGHHCLTDRTTGLLGTTV
ncbi:protein-lysine N-methyltransferase EEF2KMT-like [Pollicipes pollicipes]|uniref:protein-lysine N-methyltransferase EEF2KMT-like n=1 Tax=Pollicipes pollicipes TaxID=41117 RepID=UPI001884DBF4|nr:protein-lysine N-methyltransferase EEF2KMT-like [Pollicipes pollicipes]